MAGVRLDVARFVPSGRSLLAAIAITAAAAAAFLVAARTSVFAVERVEVRGAPPGLERGILAVTRDVVGRSLVSLDVSQIEGRVRALPTVAGVSLDRAFPHTLVIRVAPERPVAVARLGSQAWLVTGGAKVVASVDPRAEPGIPRLWLPKRVSVDVGERLPPPYVPATRALAAARDAGFGRAVKGVHSDGGQLALTLHSGLEIRLGAPRDVALKVAIARRIVRLLGAGTTFLDVSVPERPVAG